MCRVPIRGQSHPKGGKGERVAPALDCTTHGGQVVTTQGGWSPKKGAAPFNQVVPHLQSTNNVKGRG